jgi:hypothetical protein
MPQRRRFDSCFVAESSLAQTTFVPSHKAESQLPLGGTRACLHSPYPKNGGDEVHHRGEAFVGLFVTRGNAPKRFDATEKVFDEVAPFVLLAIMFGVPPPIPYVNRP